FLDGMGSGPYICKEMVVDNHAYYTLDEDWWGYEEYGADMFKELNCYVYKDQTTMAVDMETGKIDIALDCSMQDGTRAYNGEMGDRVALGLAPQNACWDIVFSPTSERTKDINVRKAIACCIDPETLEQATFGNLFGEVSTSIIPTGCDGGYVEPDVIAQYYSYDLGKAAEFLTAAGYGPGELTVQLLVETSAISSNLAEMVQAQLAEGNINCEITVADMQSFSNYLDGSNAYDMIIQHGQDNGTASGYSAVMNLSNPRFSEFNLENYGEYASLIDKCKTEVDPVKRDEYLKEFVEYGAQECLWVSLFDYSSAYLYNPKIIDIDNSYIPSIQTLNMTQVSSF
ncbi:MAG: ABC transporter substrate-binding protein, partial [Oscillospiraceae bacterium]